MKGKLIVIDGVDGCGKGTQIKLLEKKYRDREYIFTHEPGGTPEAEKIREEIFSTERKNKTPKSDFDLFWKSRLLHINDLIIPNLKKGKIIFSDRFDSSTFAFQIHGEKHSELLEEFLRLRKKTVEAINPTYIFLDLDPRKSLRRISEDTKRNPNYLDMKPLEYHIRVREGFQQFQKITEVVHLIDASKTPEDVHADVVYMLEHIIAI